MFLNCSNMTRRSPPRSRTDDREFPVRVFIAVPDGGFGLQYEAIYRWLDNNAGRGGYAVHPGGRRLLRGGIIDSIALYVRAPQSAADLLQEFPWLELADGV
jgi:hypothetical protein